MNKLLLEKPKLNQKNFSSQLDGHLIWYDFMARKMEMWLRDLGEGQSFIQVKAGTDEVFKYACKKEKSPGLHLTRFSPCWDAHFPEDQMETTSLVSLLVETWVVHVALKICQEGTEELTQLAQQKPKILVFLAVSPTYHYRMLLGQFWPASLDLDSQEGLLSKNLLSTRFPPRKIQEITGELFENSDGYSENVIWQHTYRMRVECLTLLYTASGYCLKEICQAMLRHHSRDTLGQDIRKKIEGAYHRLKNLKIKFPPSLGFFQ